ncbi:hypothetical protein K493DRAFT_203736 [Basidiobolus meristosporus CBS 931.73]|uniref:Nucleoside transporter n=1 Tax=Basidiobolus meristosporus CBS 931.73 TaxID=1314790 RepID=A0A1Y1Z722_9FUNG|nr:hypothetical protein K493DRAFT_203736 [Basidiobolus meristosporus CBS 931.73]|eukprot:ORY06072.1 hypothetical protein K493DRAFT_203736 [Basidiobolus meristosporus CBS 931.73]
MASKPTHTAYVHPVEDDFEVDSEEELIPVPLLQPPPDNYRLVYFIFLLQGAAMLLPWNVFITASEYFHLKFQGSAYANNFQNYFSICFMTSNLGFLTWALVTQKEANFPRRIVSSLITNVLIFAVCIYLVVNPHITPDASFYLVMALLVCSGATTSYLQNAVFGLVSDFAPIYMQAVMSGQGFVGTSVAATQIISAIAAKNSNNSGNTDDALQYRVYMYFICSLLVAVISLGSYYMLERQPLYEFYIAQKSALEDSDRDHPRLNPVNFRQSISQTFHSIRSLVLAIILIFLVTLGLFPSITSKIRSINSQGLFKELFIEFHFLVFNIGDWIGRSLPGNEHFVFSDERKLLLSSAARILFIPIFLSSNLMFNGVRYLPLVVADDLIYMILLLLFAISNGYLSSLIMMAGPQKVAKSQKELAGTILTLMLTLGLALGSALSFPLVAIACHCNPFDV